jgi:hypothetical protein
VSPFKVATNEGVLVKKAHFEFTYIQITHGMEESRGFLNQGFVCNLVASGHHP